MGDLVRPAYVDSIRREAAGPRAPELRRDCATVVSMTVASDHTDRFHASTSS